MDRSYWSDQLKKFHELLPYGRILEIGSGGGNEARKLIKLGYVYTGTDASSGLIKIAQRNNPDGKFVNVAADKLDFPEKFDGFWTAATLLHIPKEDIDAALKSIHGQVREGGIGFISLKAGDGGEEDEKSGRWFTYYRKDEFAEILKRNDFEIIEFKEKYEERRDKPNWLCFFVKVVDILKK